MEVTKDGEKDTRTEFKLITKNTPTSLSKVAKSVKVLGSFGRDERNAKASFCVVTM